MVKKKINYIKFSTPVNILGYFPLSFEDPDPFEIPPSSAHLQLQWNRIKMNKLFFPVMYHKHINRTT